MHETKGRGMKGLRVAVVAVVAVVGIASTQAAHAAYLNLGAANTSNAQTTLSGSSATSELRVTNGSTSTAASGVYATSPKGFALYGKHTSTVGTTAGVKGESASGDLGATALYGLLTPVSGGINSAAVRGENKSNTANGAGVFGSQAGTGEGVWGQSPKGIGVLGQTGTGTGVTAVSVTGIGLFGRHESTKWPDPGVWGDSDSMDPDASGVKGEATATNAGQYAAGVYGLSDATNRVDVYGVRGVGPTGVNGTSSKASGFGVEGVSNNTDGVGVWGHSTNATGIGVAGIANNGSGAAGIYGASTSGFAGYFEGETKVVGDLYVTGTIHNPSAAAGGGRLGTSSAASGNVRTDARGFATVGLPVGFQSSGQGFRYQLTIVGTRGWNARVARPVSGGRFTIQTDRPHVEVSWQVTGSAQAAGGKAGRVHPRLPR